MNRIIGVVFDRLSNLGFADVLEPEVSHLEDPVTHYRKVFNEMCELSLIGDCHPYVA